MNYNDAMDAVAEGDVAALETLYEEFRYIVYSLALAIVRNHTVAEDILQETFLRVYEKAETYQTGTNLKAWIASIARNLAYDVLRREKKQISGVMNESYNTIESLVVQRLELTEALLRLGEAERQIVVLYLVAGLKHAEISVLLSIPAGTVRWKYRQSLSRLAEMLGDDKHEE